MPEQQSFSSAMSAAVATIQPGKHWRHGHGGHPYLSGQIVAIRIDAAALGLLPLPLRRSCDWDPLDENWGDPPFDEWITAAIARGPRPRFELEQLLEPDLAVEADQLLEADLRYLDAHTVLGGRLMGFSPQWALHHHEVGVRIAELSVGDDLDGVLPWRLAGNRPVLAGLAAYGSCLWRLERRDEAERVFERIARLDPSDHMDARSQSRAVRAGEAWR